MDFETVSYIVNISSDAFTFAHLQLSHSNTDVYFVELHDFVVRKPPSPRFWEVPFRILAKRQVVLAEGISCFTVVFSRKRSE